MPIKESNKCVFNEEVKEKIYNLYRGSDLEVLEYLAEITKTWGNEAQEFLNRWCAEDIEADDQDTNRVNIFWEAMNYYGLTSYIDKRETEN